jgi:hypothetical protein
VPAPIIWRIRRLKIVAGNVDQVALVHVLAPVQSGWSHAATIEAVRKGAFDNLGARLEGLPGAPKATI